jgi:hypothetical protein
MTGCVRAPATMRGFAFFNPQNLERSHRQAMFAGARVLRIMTAVTPVDIAALDLAAGEFLSLLDDLAQGMPVVWVVRQRLGVQHELAARRAGAGGGDDRNLDAELVGRTGLALADAFGLGGMEGIQLPAALALLLGSDRETRASGRANAASTCAWPLILRPISRISRPRRAQNAQFSTWRLNCLAWA